MGRPGTVLAGVALILVGLSGLVFVPMLGGASFGPHGDDTDAAFIENMIPHHEDAIAMAELAQQRSQRPEIRRLAESIWRSQTEENELMREWYREWFSSDVSDGDAGGGMMGGGMMGGPMHDQTDLAALMDADDFDRAFLEQMIPHHEMAVMMTRMVRIGGDRDELRDLAESMRRQQTREIELMEAWYSEWYGQ